MQNFKFEVGRKVIFEGKEYVVASHRNHSIEKIYKLKNFNNGDITAAFEDELFEALME